MSVDIAELADEIAQGLKEYSQEVADGIKAAADEVGAEAVKELKGSSPTLTGSYEKGWTKTKVYEDTGSKRNTVHNKTDHQLTHLLEKGHASRNGGRVAGVEHIRPVEEKMVSEFEEKVKGVIGN